MVTHFEALTYLARGHNVMSCEGRRYTQGDVEPIVFIGQRAVSYRSCGMTKKEREGAWTIV